MAKIRTVPKVYIESEEIKIGNLQKALDAAKIYAEKANFYDLIKEKKMRK